jgi:hypothetical protein
MAFTKKQQLTPEQMEFIEELHARREDPFHPSAPPPLSRKARRNIASLAIFFVAFWLGAQVFDELASVVGPGLAGVCILFASFAAFTAVQLLCWKD